MKTWNGGIKGMSPGFAALSPPQATARLFDPVFCVLTPPPPHNMRSLFPGHLSIQFRVVDYRKIGEDHKLLIIYKITEIVRAL